MFCSVKQSRHVSPSPSLPVCSPDQALLPVPTPSQQLVPYPNTVPQATSVCQEALAGLQPSEQVAVLSELFSAYLKHCNIQAVEPEFLELAARGMQHLHEKGRTNVIYSMVNAVGTMRSDGSDSLLPAERIPMGLIEYAVNFFTASSVQKVNINVCAYYDHCNLHSVTQLSCMNGMSVSLLRRAFLIVHGRKL